jgi:hypothetical protein
MNIDQSTQKTVDGGSLYGRRKVYEVKTSVVLDVSRSDPSGEVHRIGETVVEQRVYHIVAANDALAHALYYETFGNPFRRHTLIDIRPLLVLDAEINVSNK